MDGHDGVACEILLLARVASWRSARHSGHSFLPCWCRRGDISCAMLMVVHGWLVGWTMSVAELAGESMLPS